MVFFYTKRALAPSNILRVRFFPAIQKPPPGIFPSSGILSNFPNITL